MISTWSDKGRVDYRVYMEPILARAASHMTSKSTCKTRSKYIRYAVIRALIADGYPLAEVSKKFEPFQRVIQRRVV